ncbi:MAG: trypsin-like peptidase domain-containing protein [Candidatus Aminicenantales bacterium]
MKKHTIRMLVFSLILLLAGSVSFPEKAKTPSKTQDWEQPVIQVFPERLPGVFDPLGYTWAKRELHARLLADHIPLSLEEAVFVHLTPEEVEEVEAYTCETCEDPRHLPGKMRVGLVKSVGIPVDFGGITMDDLLRSGRRAGVGLLRVTPEGGFIWEAAVESPAAAALRVHLLNFSLPKKAELYIFTEDGDAFGPYTFMGPRNRRDFWTHTVFGSRAYLQLRFEGPATDRDLHAVHFVIQEVGCLTSRFKLALFQREIPVSAEAQHPLCEDNAPCVEDASCYTGTPADVLKDAVALIQFVQGAWIYICSGGLLADTDPSTDIPYFLTANHCISRQKVADTLECFWQYRTAGCGGDCYDPEGVVPSTLGGDILSTSSKKGDYSFLKLWESPPEGSAFLGWTTEAVAFSEGAGLYRVSHPQGAPQAYSEHAVDPGAPECRGWPRGRWIYSRDTVGAIEGGSSGSPVANSQAQVVGQLSGACGYNLDDACDSASNATVDGAFAAYYADIEAWLNPIPGGGGKMHVSAIDPSVRTRGRHSEAVALVLIVDENGNPVSGAEVTGTFSDDVEGTKTATTDESGTATLKLRKKGTISGFTFCVDDVVHTSFIYDKEANTETCDTYPPAGS